MTSAATITAPAPTSTPGAPIAPAADPGRVNVYGYARVSTVEQGASGLGLDAQEQAIRAHAAHQGWHVIEIIREVASGKDMRAKDRPLLRDMLRRLADPDDPGKGVIVAKLDRLSRSVVDGGKMFEQARRNGWHIVAIDLQIDTSTATGELIANVMMSVGQWERRMIGERTRDALAVKKAAGVRLGRPSGLESNDATERARAATGARRICELRAEGLSFRAVTDRLNEEGIPTIRGTGRWGLKTVHRVAHEAATAIDTPRAPACA
jgi:DNA invertase Pin-like site-specific DNA recombinase